MFTLIVYDRGLVTFAKVTEYNYNRKILIENPPQMFQPNVLESVAHFGPVHLCV